MSARAVYRVCTGGAEHEKTKQPASHRVSARIALFLFSENKHSLHRPVKIKQIMSSSVDIDETKKRIWFTVLEARQRNKEWAKVAVDVSGTWKDLIK